MISYELSLKLKEAGYPQVSSEYRYEHGKFRSTHSDFYNCGHPDGDDIAAPTLEELIEACGDRFAGLLASMGDGYTGWGKKYLAAADNACIECNPAYETNGMGDTPEEAVANLWMNLQSK